MALHCEPPDVRPASEECTHGVEDPLGLRLHGVRSTLELQRVVDPAAWDGRDRSDTGGEGTGKGRLREWCVRGGVVWGGWHRGTTCGCSRGRGGSTVGRDRRRCHSIPCGSVAQNGQPKRADSPWVGSGPVTAQQGGVVGTVSLDLGDDVEPNVPFRGNRRSRPHQSELARRASWSSCGSCRGGGGGRGAGGGASGSQPGD